MLEEKGYAEFVEKKVQKGLQDFEQGHFYKEDQARQRLEQMLMRKEQALQQEIT